MSRAALLCCLLLVGGEAASPSPQTQGEPRPRTIPPLALPALPRPVGPTGVPADSGTALPAFLEVSLSEGVAGEEAVPAGVAVVLSRERVQALLSRLPFEAGPTGTEPSGPGPDEDSGAGAAPAAPADTSLRVVSVLPGGETDLAPWVTVVFSRPMVPLGRDGEPLSGELRVRLDPEPPGGWRWLDVRTLRFEPDGGRLPAATSYSVTVPAGTRSADGAALENAFEATFAVAGPRALGGYPNALAGSDDGLADRDPVVLLTFDQRMDARDVLAGATLVADSVARPLRLVGRTELGDRDPRLAEAARRAGDATWVALRPERPLPPGTDAVLRLAADLPSREGPRPAGLVQELRFRVRGSFEVTGTRCDGAEASCVPDGLWWADLSNPLDPDQPVAERVRVGPEVEGLRAFAMGGRLRLHGDFRPHTTYEVRLLPDLRDRFGQRLGQTVDLRVRFGEPYPYLLVPGGPFVVLDPAAGRNLEVASRGLSEVEVTAYRVEPEDWPRYRADLERRRSGLPPEWVPGGEPPARWTVRPEGGGSGFSRVALDLSRVFPDGGGHALVRLEGRSGGGMPGRRPSDTTMASAWVQATSFAIGGVWDPGELVGWAVSLDDGHPLEGVELRLPGSGLAHPTDVRGLARIGLRDGTDSLLVARWGEEVAILPALTATGYREGWVGGPAFPAPVWFSLTDRGLYRPGEKLEGHGWIRALAGEPRRDLTLPRDVDSVRWEVHTGRDRSVARGVVPVSRSGTFHLVAGLPGTMRPGPARLHLAAVARGDSVPGWSSWTYFRVEDFRRPDYEVTGELDQGPWLAGGSMEALATARYYDGAALPGSPVEWRVRSGPTWWSPPGWSGWSFGAWDGGRGRAVEGAWSLEGRTDARGRHALRIGTGALALPFPVAIDVEAQVRDLDRQAGSVRLGAVVHPARRTAGIRTDRIWVRAGEELGFDVVVVDLDGAPVVGAAPVVRALLEPDSTRVGSRGVEEPAPVSCTRGDEERVAGRPVMPLRCGLRPPAPGAYRLEAEVVDARGRRSVTEVRRWVLTSTDPWVSAAPEGELVLTPDRERYRPGDTARIMIVAPFYPLEGLLTVVHHGIRGVEPLRIEGPGRVVRLPIHEEDAGGLEVRVDVSGSVGGHDGFSVRRELAVELGSRRLQVDVTPDRDVVRPGDSVVVEVAVRDADGRPAGGQVALWLVDEAILSLGGYRLGDPLESLHRFRYDSRRGVFLPQRAVRWMRRPLGPGLVSAELLDATTGSPASVLRVSVDGADRGWVQRGNLLLRDVPAGTHRLVLSRGGEPVLERTVDVPGGGLDLGTLLLGEGGERLELRIRGASGRLDALTVAAGTFEANMSPGELARLATPMAPTPTGPPVVLRRLFRALAAFEPAAELDGRGKARITVRLPDTMTRYRIMAVASQGATHFGTAEGAVTARRGLTLRASPPRFLHPGDRPELPLIVQNASDETVDAEVVARASGMELEGDRGFRVRLPAGGRTELRFPARVVRTGSADFEALAVAAVPGGERTDGMGVAVPVSPALAPGAVAVHRRLTAGDSLRLVVETPAGAYPGFGGVEVGLSTTLLQPLVEVLRSLCLQPLYWPEPTIARVLGMAALDGELESLRATDLPSPEELRARTEVDVERLVAWLRPYVYTPAAAGPERGFLSGLELVHGVHAIAVAADAGYPAAGEAVRSMGLLVRRVWKEELDREVAAQRAPTGWERATAAYALHVGMRLDAIGPGPEVALWMKELEPADLPVEALAWLLGPAAQVADSAVLRARWFRELENRALTTGATATFRQGGRVSVGSAEGDLDRLVLASDRRADAAVLAVLVEEAPDHPLVPGLVRGLLGQRDGSAAAGAHENGWVLLALGRYAAMHEAEAAELAVRTRLGGRPLGGEVRLGAAGRTGSDTVLTGPLPVPGRPISLEVTSEGQGTLYVRAGLRFAPVVSPDAPAEDQGFLVSRRYESVDEASDVRRGEDGVWRIRAGARVRVRVTFTAPARRYRVQLLDPLPAGLEAVNPRLRGTGFADDPEPPTRLEPPPGRVSAPLAASLSNFPWGWDLTDTLFRWRAWQGVWATHEELRDDRLEAYTPWLPAGTYQSTWLVRATTPGTFLAPPPRVEETEHPETFGQGRADRVVVEAGPIGWRVAPGG